MNDPLEMKKLQDGCPVMGVKIPPQIQKELDLTMAMCGETDISNAGMHNLHHNPFK